MTEGDNTLLILCAYMTPALLAVPGNIPAKCGMCGTQIVLSAPATEVVRSQAAKPVCPTCVAENAPDGTTGLALPEVRALLETMGFEEDFIRKIEATSIKELAALVRDHHARTELN